ncbi:unnamed protein product [Blepharisma stoltei]|uniref:Uncharacterized protein n=1 Tax=Blepharisma stoltei TaxID=1481888 RepID=A0AAU9JPT9_9CILI|nr:unnamed protein product [Blepharisma stoltei]
MNSDLKYSEKLSSSLIENLYVEEEPRSSKYELQSDDRLELEELIDGHLILGFWVHRPGFSRLSRLFTLITVVLFELMLEEVLLFVYGNSDNGEIMGSQDLVSNYINKYLGYTILAVITVIPIEAFMIASLSLNRKQTSNWAAASIVIGILIMIGSVVGIFVMNSQMDFEWYALWGLSFFTGILLEAGIVESFFMFARYFVIQSFGPFDKYIK